MPGSDFAAQQGVASHLQDDSTPFLVLSQNRCYCVNKEKPAHKLFYLPFSITTWIFLLQRAPVLQSPSWNRQSSLAPPPPITRKGEICRQASDQGNPQTPQWLGAKGVACQPPPFHLNSTRSIPRHVLALQGPQPSWEKPSSLPLLALPQAVYSCAFCSIEFLLCVKGTASCCAVLLLQHVSSIAKKKERVALLQSCSSSGQVWSSSIRHTWLDQVLISASWLRVTAKKKTT